MEYVFHTPFIYIFDWHKLPISLYNLHIFTFWDNFIQYKKGGII